MPNFHLLNNGEKQMKTFAVLISSHGEVEAPSFSAYRNQIRHIFHHASAYMHIPKPVLHVIPTVGGALMTLKYRRARYLSPHNHLTRQQAEKVKAHLSNIATSLPVTLEVIPTFETTPPYTEDQLQDAMQRYDGVIVLAMNPIDGDLSCGTLCRFAQQTFPPDMLSKLTVIGGLWRDEALSAVYCTYILSQIQELTLYGRVGLILIMHGTVVAQKNGAPVSFRNGLKETESFYERLASGLRAASPKLFSHITVAYLNHTVGGRWTTPTLEDAIATLKAHGIETAVAFASGYFTDSSETHHAAEVLSRAKFRAAYYLPCVNDTDDFTRYLAERIQKAARGLLHRQALLELPPKAVENSSHLRS
ncbi:MAG: ferrochelatase [Chloroherpetonaceae bacterium]|nr:ferrochelatase [Chloroherpetonaceae bacterium]